MKGRVYREIYMLYFFAHFKKVIKKPLTFCYGRGRIGGPVKIYAQIYLQAPAE